MGELCDIVGQYAEKSPVRFHMPGHKGKAENLNGLSFRHDVTELFFTDNLLCPSEKTNLIYGLEKRISECFFPNADIYSLISCSGATLCVQTAVLAMKNLNPKKGGGEHIICDRASHVSFANAAALLGIKPLWIYPEEDFAEKIGCFAKIQNVAGVFVTSPNYFGEMKDIEKISKECKKCSLPLAVDNSHGAHLAFHSGGILHPANLGADLSIDSVHKTLPALTGAALLHASGTFDKESILRPAMRMFASTSPSYLILQSIERMVDFLEASGTKEHERLLCDICLFKEKAAGLGFAFGGGEFLDPYRIVLGCGGSGEKLYRFLAEKNIFCEFFDDDDVVILASVSNGPDDFEKLFCAIGEFAENNEIVTAKSKKTSYPPGVPDILPGEK